MNIDKKAVEILNETLNKHEHRMSDALFGSTEEMVLDAIKQALTIPIFDNQRGLLIKFLIDNNYEEKDDIYNINQIVDKHLSKIG